ncbi:hypothetical protein B0H14DRAFT_2571044 [Mycena olivaceomarginata]|nr:hypothetical protein B0H14DRAFT_2571044 [Mycena olivaceomarginata]
MCAPPLTFHYVHAIRPEHTDVLDSSRETRCVVVSSRSVHVAGNTTCLHSRCNFSWSFRQPHEVSIKVLVLKASIYTCSCGRWEGVDRALDWDSIHDTDIFDDASTALMPERSGGMSCGSKNLVRETVFGCGSQQRWVRWMIFICAKYFFEAAQMGEIGLQIGTVVEHETANGGPVIMSEEA